MYFIFSLFFSTLRGLNVCGVCTFLLRLFYVKFLSAPSINWAHRVGPCGQEQEYFRKMVQQCKDAGTTLVCCQWGFDDDRGPCIQTESNPPGRMGPTQSPPEPHAPCCGPGQVHSHTKGSLQEAVGSGKMREPQGSQPTDFTTLHFFTPPPITTYVDSPFKGFKP